MSVELQKEQKSSGGRTPEVPESSRLPYLAILLTALKEVKWGITLLTGLAMAVGWCMFFLSTPLMQLLSGIMPVTAGLFLGRHVKTRLLIHGIILGISGFLFGLIVVSVYGGLMVAGVVPPIQAPAPEGGGVVSLSLKDLILYYMSFSSLALLFFPPIAVKMGGRTEERNRASRKQVEERGGRLERPGVVRTLEDLRGLSLPQLGGYVNNLFQKHKFTFEDYRFVDKDKHLDLEMTYQGYRYLLRLSVADKVRPGTIETLTQDMRRRNISKGLVITSTEFTPEAEKSGKGRRQIVLISGQTLFDIAEGH